MSSICQITDISMHRIIFKCSPFNEWKLKTKWLQAINNDAWHHINHKLWYIYYSVCAWRPRVSVCACVCAKQRELIIISASDRRAITKNPLCCFVMSRTISIINRPDYISKEQRKNQFSANCTQKRYALRRHIGIVNCAGIQNTKIVLIFYGPPHCRLTILFGRERK